MELKDFIAETLVGIQQGVQLAIERTGKAQVSGVINPVWGKASLVGDSHIREVQFDIAVTVTDKSSGKAAAGIKVVGIGVGGDHQHSEENARVSRIQFSVPVVPPVTEVPQ
jgi:hypothetical protein